MIIRQVKDWEGHPYAFEIKNSAITLCIIQKILSSVGGVSNIKKNKFFGLFSYSSIRVRFLYRGVSFVVVEPYGDSDVFWIGPENTGEGTEGTVEIEAAFKAYKLPLFIRIISRLLNLDFPET